MGAVPKQATNNLSNNQPPKASHHSKNSMKSPRTPPPNTHRAVCPPTPYGRHPKAGKNSKASAPTGSSYTYLTGYYGEGLLSKIVRAPRVEVASGDFGRVYETTYKVSNSTLHEIRME